MKTIGQFAIILVVSLLAALLVCPERKSTRRWLRVGLYVPCQRSFRLLES
jgi:hypothetical protein